MQVTTNRLIIRPLRTDDAVFFIETRNHPEVKPWIGFVPTTTKEVHAFQAGNEQRLKQLDAWYQCIIELKPARGLIGDIALHFLPNNEVEIGYVMHPQFTGKGYMKEALHAITKYAFEHLGIARSLCNVDPINKASIGVLKGVGYKHVETVRGAFLFREKYVDNSTYSIRPEEITPYRG